MSVAGIADGVVGPLIRALVDAGSAPEEGRASELDRADIAERFSRAAWTCIAEPGDRVSGMLIETLGAESALTTLLARPDAEKLLRLVEGAGGVLEADSRVNRLDELAAALERWRPRLASSIVLRALEQSRRVGVGLVIPTDPEWPSGLADLGQHAPAALWFRGSRPHWAGLARGIAVVGARAATGYGEHVAAELSAGLVDRGYWVVSGAAYGIDGAAHRAALGSASSDQPAATAAILAGGLDRYYPSGHDELITRIADRGLVAAEVPCGTAPTKWRFLARNRLIAAMTRATVVVEAGRRSGSINTAHHALDLGRPIAAVPGPVTSATSAGCHRILRDWPATLVTSAEEVAELVPLDTLGLVAEPRNVVTAPASSDPAHDARDVRGVGSAPGRFDPESARLRLTDALSTRNPRSPERLAALSGLALERVRAELGLLELEGGVRRHQSGWTRVADPAR